jgi:hypothetical protein
VKEGEIIYMLPEASRLKAGQIGLAFPWHTSSNQHVNISFSTLTAAVPTYDHKAGKVVIFNEDNFPD